MAEHTRPDRSTRDKEKLEAQKGHDPGRVPTDADAATADSVALDGGVARHEMEMAERGAHERAEGRRP